MRNLLLQRPIDLLLDEPSDNPYFEVELMETKQLIYEQTGEEVSHDHEKTPTESSIPIFAPQCVAHLWAK